MGNDGGPTNLPLNSARHSPRGTHPPVKHDSLGDGTHTYINIKLQVNGNSICILYTMPVAYILMLSQNNHSYV